MLAERLAPPARLALELAKEEANDANDVAVTPHHLLVGILLTPGSGAARVLEEAGVTLDSLSLRRHDEYRVRSAVIAPGQTVDAATLGTGVASLVQRAYELADEMGHAIVDTAHVLLAVLEAPDEFVSAHVIGRGLSPAAARALLFGQR